jgi:hypothetical protein
LEEENNPAPTGGYGQQCSGARPSKSPPAAAVTLNGHRAMYRDARIGFLIPLGCEPSGCEGGGLE